MQHAKAVAALAMLGLIASTAPSFAFGAIGCNVLPEHERALGTIENGPYTCGMSTEEAERILARDSGQPATAPPVAPVPRKHHRKKSHRHQ